MATQTSNRHPGSEDTSVPFEIAHDSQAGLRLYKYDRFKQVQLRFDNDVPQSVEEQLQRGGWTFREQEGVYTRQYGSHGPATAIVEARRLFGELCRQLNSQPTAGVSR